MDRPLPKVAPYSPSISTDGVRTPHHLLTELTAMDWNFQGAITNDLTHGFHPYPARFIPQIPRVLISKFTRMGDVVYDPFVGCGTTCVEANALGRQAIGNDVNPLAVLITQVKTSPLNNKFLFKASKLAQEVILVTQQSPQKSNFSPEIPEESIDWFDDFVGYEISAIKEMIYSLKDELLRDFCKVALSAIIISVSRQDSDTRYVRVPKKINPSDVGVRFARQLSRMIEQIRNANDAIGRAHTSVIVADSRKPNIFPDNHADFVVTSPPYPNAYDYHLYHRHRLLWLDMDPRKLKSREIGAHAHYSKKNGANATDFHNDMKDVLEVSIRILKPGKYLAFVVGDSILRGEHIDNCDLIKSAAKDLSLITVGEIPRKIDSTKKSFNPAHGNIKEEKILILRYDP